MSKIVSGFLALCLTVAVAAGAQAAPDRNTWNHGNGMAKGHHKHHCGPGQHWVKGYTNRNGKHVKGYCR
jgi:Spy/CpxP family protein refolding chaperone